MKPFDLEAAKRGEPVCNRDGDIAESVHVLSDFPEECCVAAHFDDGSASLYSIDGRRWLSSSISGDPWLFMAPRKREGWVNICKGNVEGEVQLMSCVYDGPDEAIASANGHRMNRIATVRIEWEE